MGRPFEIGVLGAASALALLFVVAVSGTALADPWVRPACGLLCHQLPERGLAPGGHAMAVCARCFGLYAGGAIGIVVVTLLTWFGRPYRLPRWLLLFAVPTTVDGFVALTLGSGVTNVPRAGISVPAGLVLGLFLADGIRDLARMLARPDSAAPSSPADGPRR